MKTSHLVTITLATLGLTDHEGRLTDAGEFSAALIDALAAGGQNLDLRAGNPWVVADGQIIVAREHQVRGPGRAPPDHRTIGVLLVIMIDAPT